MQQSRGGSRVCNPGLAPSPAETIPGYDAVGDVYNPGYAPSPTETNRDYDADKNCLSTEFLWELLHVTGTAQNN